MALQRVKSPHDDVKQPFARVDVMLLHAKRGLIGR